MTMRRLAKLSELQLALAALFISAAVQLACYIRSPRDPMNDVDYSIFAAQNLLARGQLKSVNLLADYRDDLAQFAQLRWMVHYPPGHSLLYAAAMSLGLNASDATTVMALTGILAGGIGWVLLARFLGASRNCTVILALLYPWLPWALNAYQIYETEHVALALMPWFCLALIRIVPLSATNADAQVQAPNQNRQLLVVTLLALGMVTLKYSMSAVFPAAALYLWLQDGRSFVERSIGWKAVVIGLLIFPLIMSGAVNLAYGPRAVQIGPNLTHFEFNFARNLLNNSVSATLGWDSLVARAFAIARAQPFRGLIDLLSLITLSIGIMHFRRHPPEGRLRSFVMLLVLLTIILWLSLAASTYLGHKQWNFSSESRFYMPITLMWLMGFAVSLDAMRAPAMLRSPAFYALTLPVLLTAAVGLRVASRQPADPAMPASGIAWAVTRNSDHAAFLAKFAQVQGHKPDLLISMPSIMNELQVPSFATGYFVTPGHHYWSSKPLELWALVIPSQEKALLANSAGPGVRIERAATPPGYPFLFYIIKFQPRPDR